MAPPEHFTVAIEASAMERSLTGRLPSPKVGLLQSLEMMAVRTVERQPISGSSSHPNAVPTKPAAGHHVRRIRFAEGLEGVDFITPGPTELSFEFWSKTQALTIDIASLDIQYDVSYIKFVLTPNQLRAARALLSIDQRTLADLAGVSLPTIQRMEASDGYVRGVVDTLTKVIAALEREGIELISENSVSAGGGRGVRLRDATKPSLRGPPVRRVETSVVPTPIDA